MGLRLAGAFVCCVVFAAACGDSSPGRSSQTSASSAVVQIPVAVCGAAIQQLEDLTATYLEEGDSDDLSASAGARTELFLAVTMIAVSCGDDGDEQVATWLNTMVSAEHDADAGIAGRALGLRFNTCRNLASDENSHLHELIPMSLGICETPQPTATTFDHSDETPPRVNNEHWHSAYEISVCGQRRVVLPDDSVDDATGIHSHGDGLIHIHPFVVEAAGVNATIGAFFTESELAITDSALVLPDETLREDTDTCAGEPAEIRILKWDTTDADSFEVFTSGLADVRLDKNGQLFAIVFGPAAASNDTVPRPDDTFLRRHIGQLPIGTPTTTTAAPPPDPVAVKWQCDQGSITWTDRTAADLALSSTLTPSQEVDATERVALAKAVACELSQSTGSLAETWVDGGNVAVSGVGVDLSVLKTLLEPRSTLALRPVIATAQSNTDDEVPDLVRRAVELANNSNAVENIDMTQPFDRVLASAADFIAPNHFATSQDRTLVYLLGPPEPTIDIESADVQNAEQVGWTIQLSLTPQGAITFDDIAARNLGRQVALVIDDIVISAPTIQSAQFEGAAVISGNFDGPTAWGVVIGIAPRFELSPR